MLKLSIKQSLFAVLFVPFFASCDKDNDVPQPEVAGNFQYIVVATPEGSASEASDYLLQTGSLTEGSITTVGAGIEQDGYRTFVFHKNKAFSLLYGQGNPGAVTTYALDENGVLARYSNLQTETVQVFGTYNDELILIKTPRQGDANAGIYRIDAVNPQILATGYTDVVQLAGNGERAHFTGAFQVGDKIYAPYMCIKGVAGQVFHTDFTDSTWIAVYSYPDLKLEKVIKDNRTSYLGYYYAQNGMAQIENGDVYAFSTATLGDISQGITPSTKPSAAIRIKKGTSEFDQSYFFNIQEKSGGYHLERAFYLSGTKFLLTIHPDKTTTGSGASKVKFAIVDVVAQSFTWVTGLPEPEALVDVSRLPYISDDGQVIAFGITVAGEYPHVYTIDVAAAKATKGLEVVSGSITSIGKLTF
ncbi:hypothetical protein EZS27_020363 [termite gut metagenome]|uniref:DUF4374 domain-containing protein n=1 Tax=termite gut metagenome TaxID=433724 RepID=A0A5J4RBI1_9ZZZZ